MGWLWPPSCILCFRHGPPHHLGLPRDLQDELVLGRGAQPLIFTVCALALRFMCFWFWSSALGPSISMHFPLPSYPYGQGLLVLSPELYLPLLSSHSQVRNFLAHPWPYRLYPLNLKLGWSGVGRISWRKIR